MSNDRPANVWRGVLAATVGAAVVTAFSSVAPAAIHKLVLFSIAYGLGVAWIVAWASAEFGMPRRVGLTLALVLIGSGLVAIAMYRHHRYCRETESAAKSDPEQMMALNLLKSGAQDDPEVAADYQRYLRRLNPTFTDYLAVRVRPLGEWEHPRPTGFWAAEIVLATFAGAVLFWKLTNRHSPASDLRVADTTNTSETQET